MADTDKQLSDLKKEVVEARNLVIRNDNLLKNVHTDLKTVLAKQGQFERRMWMSAGATYVAFAALAALGAFMWAKVYVKATSEELISVKASAAKTESAAAKIKNAQDESERASKRALDVFERLAGGDEGQRNIAIGDLAHLDMKKLTPFEQRALEDKSHTLLLDAAKAALDAGKAAFNRHDWKGTDDALTRYLALDTQMAAKPDDQAYFLLGAARHSARDYKDAVEPLQTYLKNVPGSKQGDYATMMLGEAMAESGDVKGSVDVYRNGGNKYITSPYVMMMRARARRMEQRLKDTEKPVASLPPPPHTTP